VATDTFMALTLLGCFLFTVRIFWADETVRRREERKFQQQIEQQATPDL